MSLNLFLYHSKNNNYFYTNQKTALLFQTRRFYYSDNACVIHTGNYFPSLSFLYPS